MQLPKSLATVTLLSKVLALSLFILLPLGGFYIGSNYQSKTSSEISSSTKQGLPDVSSLITQEDFNRALVGIYKNYGCDIGDCLFENYSDPKDIAGFTNIEGYYTSQNVEITAELGSYTKQCDSFVVTKSDARFKEHFLNLINLGNAYNSTDSDGNVILRINLANLQQADKSSIFSSSKNSDVKLAVLVDAALGRGILPCESQIDIIKAI